jgi:hypothetical protein
VRRRRRWTASLVVVATLLTSCSSDDPEDAGTTTTTAVDAEQGEATVTYRASAPSDVGPPPAEGDGIALPQPAAAVPDGYVLEELLVGGSATRFDPVDTPEDGRWTVEPAGEADYRTRVVVRRPSDPAAFSGTVLVEWFNVSAIEAAPDWGYLSEEITREGHAYVGVSVQSQGVEGGDPLLSVEVDEAEAAEAGVDTSKSGLRNVDPDRYGTLTHPGDAYAFDIFNQVGRLVGEDPAAVLGDLEPEHVIAMGESQSAMFLTTFVNAIHPLDPVFDGFLIHSRGATVPPMDGDYRRSREAAVSGSGDGIPPAVLVRTDLDVPVLVFETETDLTYLGYSRARQPDTDRIRTWEVAGTSHADAQTLRAVIGGPRDPGIGSILGCGSINTGPHKEVLQAALHHLVAWVAGGPPPPEAPRIQLTDGDEPDIARDELGNALGGIRNPLVDVPVAGLSGDPVTDGSEGGSICTLFGSTTPFDSAALLQLHGSADDYVERFEASAADAVDAGFLLPADAEALIAEAEANRALFG